ncbi:hypothetical protein H1164_16820 [Thermoactinomyces daqus]|uniref:Uncharacterized protein n=1 Tax=Thermoactinomyces daqus TaxID=1329516 RepID=A0A7W2AK27_9BACL|nr:hypothetical protein [Thermoactinomyces daqus]MBA4544498.1 hypothetical protein [Thermoactinomyces daqus]
MNEDFGHPSYPFNKCHFCGKDLSPGEAEVNDDLKVCCKECYEEEVRRGKG